MLVITLYCLAALVTAFRTLRDKCPTKAETEDVVICFAIGLWWPLFLILYVTRCLFMSVAKLYNKRYS